MYSCFFPASEAEDGAQTAAHEEVMEAPIEKASKEAETVIDEALDNKYLKYASSMFEARVLRAGIF